MNNPKKATKNFTTYLRHFIESEKKSIYILKTKGTSGYLNMKMHVWSKSFTCFSPGVISTKQKGARQPSPPRVFFNYYRTFSSLSNLSYFHESTILNYNTECLWALAVIKKEDQTECSYQAWLSRTTYRWGQLIGCYGLKGGSSKEAPTTRGHFPGYESRWSFTGFYGFFLWSTQLGYDT